MKPYPLGGVVSDARFIRRKHNGLLACHEKRMEMKDHCRRDAKCHQIKEGPNWYWLFFSKQIGFHNCRMGGIKLIGAELSGAKLS